VALDRSQDQYNVTVKNTGDSPVDLNSTTLSIGRDGGTPQAVEILSSSGNSCVEATEGWQEDALTAGSSSTCATDVSLGQEDDAASTTISISLGGYAKDQYTCTEESNAEFC